MSNDPTNVTPITTNKPNALQKAVGFVKTHKAATITVGVLSGLLVAGAVLDRKQGQLVVDLGDPIEIEFVDSPDN